MHSVERSHRAPLIGQPIATLERSKVGLQRRKEINPTHLVMQMGGVSGVDGVDDWRENAYMPVRTTSRKRMGGAA